MGTVSTLMPLWKSIRGGSWLSKNALLYDTFTTAESAPLTSPRTCEPGPGTLTITETDGSFDIASDVLDVTAQSTPAVGDLEFLEATGYTRAAGLSVFVKIKNDAVTGQIYPGFGFFNTATITSDTHLQHGINQTSATIRVRRNASTVTTFLTTATTSWQSHNIVCRSTGFYYILDGTLMWIDNDNGTAGSAMYPGLVLWDRAIEADDFAVSQLSDYNSAWGSQSGIATYANASPTANDTDTSLADAVHQFSWTVATSETLALYIRRTDDSNAWIIRGDQAGSTIKIIEIETGGETERGSSAQTWTNTTEYDLQFYADGADIEVFVDGTSMTSYGSATFNQTVTGTKCAGFATGADWNAFPRDLSSLLPSELR